MDWMNDSITHSLIHSEIIISRELRGQIFRRYWTPIRPSGVQLSGLLVKEFWKSIRTLFLFVPFCWEDSILKEHVRCYFYSTWRFSFLLYEAHSKLMTLGDQRPWGKLSLPYHLPGTERVSPLPSIFPKSSTTLVSSHHWQWPLLIFACPYQLQHTMSCNKQPIVSAYLGLLHSFKSRILSRAEGALPQSQVPRDTHCCCKDLLQK